MTGWNPRPNFRKGDAALDDEEPLYDVLGMWGKESEHKLCVDWLQPVEGCQLFRPQRLEIVEEQLLGHGPCVFNGDPHKAMSKAVFVGNIPFEMTEEQIVDIFKEVGPVVNFR